MSGLKEPMGSKLLGGKRKSKRRGMSAKQKSKRSTKSRRGTRSRKSKK